MHSSKFVPLDKHGYQISVISTMHICNHSNYVIEFQALQIVHEPIKYRQIKWSNCNNINSYGPQKDKYKFDRSTHVHHCQVKLEQKTYVFSET